MTEITLRAAQAQDHTGNAREQSLTADQQALEAGINQMLADLKAQNGQPEPSPALENPLALVTTNAPPPARPSDKTDAEPVSPDIAQIADETGAEVLGAPLPAAEAEVKTPDMAAATNAEIAAATAASPVPAVAEPIAELREGEENVIEAIEAKEEAQYKVPPSLLAKLKKQGTDFLRKHKADLARLNKPFREAEARIAKKKQADEYVARGLPADFDDLPDTEKKRLSKNLAQRKWRASIRKPPKPSIEAGASIPTFSHEWRADRQRELDAHLSALDPARAGQLRRSRPQIIDDLIVVLEAGGKISDYKLGKQLRISEGAASTRNKRLKVIAAAIGGAWKQPD